MLICFHAPSPLVYFGLFRINTMAHTLGMSIQQHQQKSLLKFYVLPRARTSRFPEKSSEKRLKTPWVKVQVHRICLTRQLASFCHASKNGRKKARKPLKLLGFSQRHLFWCSLMVDLKRLELSTSRMRTERSPEWFRYMHPKFLKNNSKYKNIEKI